MYDMYDMCIFKHTILNKKLQVYIMIIFNIYKKQNIYNN